MSDWKESKHLTSESIEMYLSHDHDQRYEILELIGQGGMGQVYRAIDHRLNRKIAIKFIKTEFSENTQRQLLFFREAQATAQLSHPYIVPIYDVGYWPGRGIYLVMKEIKGQSLTHLIRDFHRLSDGWYNSGEAVKFLKAQNWLDFCVILRQVAQAIGFAHKHGMLHRDLKPDNIMIGADGEVWILDWGVAKIFSIPEEATPVSLYPVQYQQALKSNDIAADVSAQFSYDEHQKSQHIPKQESVVKASEQPTILPMFNAELETIFEEDHLEEDHLSEESNLNEPIPMNFTPVISHSIVPKILDSAQSRASVEESKTSSLTAQQFVEQFTFTGRISGTPAYMSPEQAKALPLDSRSDSYSLGAILFEILSNQPPFIGKSTIDVLKQVISTEIPPLDHIQRDGISPLLYSAPMALKELCFKALSKDLIQRPKDGTDFAEALKLIERGADQYKQAQQCYKLGLKISSELKELQAKNLHLKQKIEQTRYLQTSEVGQYWSLQRKTEQRIQMAQMQEMQEYERAILLCPDYYPALLALCEKLLKSYQLEFLMDLRSPELSEIRTKLQELYPMLPQSQELKHKIKLLLAQKHFFPIEILDKDAIIEVIFEGDSYQKIKLTQDQLQKHSFPKGVYQLKVTHPSKQEFYIHFDLHSPFSIENNNQTLQFKIPKKNIFQSKGNIKIPACSYIPAGHFRYGSKECIANELNPVKLHLQDFWITTKCIKFDEYLSFLNDLIHFKNLEERDKYIPKSNIGDTTQIPAFIYIPEEDRYEINTEYRDHFCAITNLPISEAVINFVSWENAQCYALWLTERTGRVWRLPTEWEWEKAVRGVDGRLFPWGDHCNKETADCKKASPYGLLECSGLVGNWCLNERKRAYPLANQDEQKKEIETWRSSVKNEMQQRYETESPVRGGGFFNTGLSRSITYRFSASAHMTFADIGIRLLCEVIPSDFQS